jgi:diadenosine tetraphosphate (Ap4A) HIT family hydrolase
MSPKMMSHCKKSLLIPIFAVILLMSIIASAQVKNGLNSGGSLKANKPYLTLPGEYDPTNMLARTARGEIPSAKLYEDDYVLAVLGENPYATGHFVVFSKTSKARNFIEMTPEDLSRIMTVAQRVAEAEIIAIGAEGFTLRQSNGSASSIAQFHLHVIPRWKGDQLKDKPGSAVSISELELQAKKIRAALDAL